MGLREPKAGTVEAAVRAFTERWQAWRTHADVFLVPKLAEAVASGLAPQDIASVAGKIQSRLRESQIWGTDYGYEDDPEVDGPDAPVQIAGADAAGSKDGWAEVAAMQIELPSACDVLLLGHPCMATAAAMERELREAAANDALADLRVQLITSYAFLRDEQTLTGQVATTRAAGMRKTKWRAVEDAAATYRRARRASRVLAGANGDGIGRRLQKADVRPFKAYMCDDRPGSNAEVPSWIWEELAFGSMAAVGGFEDYAEDGKHA